MRVLVACERSGVVREAFRARGHVAYSCDVLPAIDGSAYHIMGDAMNALDPVWDLMIAHPPCTYLTIAAAWAFKDGPYHQRVKPGTLVGAARRAARDASVDFFRALLDAPIARVAIENPVGAISTLFRKPDQIVQPWQFGEDASKATCLWLKNLPLLRHTCVLPGGRTTRRANQTASGQNRLGPSPTRAAERAKTYQGIADAMADQWGVL